MNTNTNISILVGATMALAACGIQAPNIQQQTSPAQNGSSTGAVNGNSSGGSSCGCSTSTGGSTGTSTGGPQGDGNANGAFPVVADPNQPPGAGGAENLVWTYLSGTILYPSGGPVVGDVLQNQSSDCVFDSTLAGALLQNPNALESHIRQVGVTVDGEKVFSVHMYFANAWHDVLVDEKLLDSSTTLYDPFVQDSVTGDRVLWASMFRKAYSFVAGGYDTGSSIATAMTALIGPTPGFNGAVAYGTNAQDANAEPYIAQALAQKNVTVTVSFTSALLARGALNGASTATDDGSSFYCATASDGNSYCVAANHAYTVVSDANSSITVRNPWGSDAVGVPGAGMGGDEYMTLPFDAYRQLFSQTYWAGFDPNSTFIAPNEK